MRERVFTSIIIFFRGEEVMRKLLNLVLVICLIVTIPAPLFENAAIANGETPSNLVSDVSLGELLKNNELNESEDAGTFASMWEKGQKPTYWDLRNWANSGGANPQAKLIQDLGKNMVQIDLNKTVGFFQYYSSIPVNPNSIYHFNAKVKTKDIQTPHSSKNAVTLRVEQLKDSTVLVRNDLAFVKNHSGESDWVNLSGAITTRSDTNHVRVILITGQVSAGNGSTGTIWVDSMSMKPEVVSLESITLAPESLAIPKGDTAELSYTLNPKNATFQELEWSSSNKTVASVANGKVTGLSGGDATITVSSKNEPSIKATATVTILEGDIPVTGISLDHSQVRLNEGKGTIVTPTILPSYASNHQVVWSSSNENIVTVNGGVIQALQPGSAVITATTVDGNHQASTTIVVDQYEEDEYDQMRKKWANYVVQNTYIDLANPLIKQKIDKLSEDAKVLWTSMDKSTDRTYIWENASSKTNSADVTTSFRNLKTLTSAYATKGSELQGNPKLLKDIIHALDWMIDNRYNGNHYNNWWDWQIGAPQLLNDITAVLYEYLRDEQIAEYMNSIKTYVPRPTHYYGVGGATWSVEATGANLVDLTKVAAVQGIISKEESRVISGRDHFPVIEIKKSGTGNGLYSDGSFVDHSNIAYTGTYGVVLLGSMVDMIYLLENSSFTLNEEDLNNIYDMILDAFQPVIYRGLMMDMVNGRAISRGNVQDIGHGIGAIERIIQYMEFAPKNYKSKFESMVKYWISSNDSVNLIERFNRIPVITMANTIMNDSSIQSSGELIGHYNFANMDRAVHRRPGYVFGISMYSDRIGAYEGNMNGENQKGFYTGSGMTYLYNNDLQQYSGDFWPTVDSYRLPGTTVDATKQLPVGAGTGRTSPQSWVGGSKIEGLYGTNGMFLDQSIYGMSLKGKKSWFMFDNEVIALGSDIKSTDGRPIETIVENRKLLDNGNNALYVDNQKMSSKLGWTEEKEGVKWAHLSGNAKGSDIGYYFPETADVKFQREARTGSWKEINTTGSDQLITRNYMKMVINHGVNPSNGSYSYVLLPNKSKEETAKYSENPDIKVLANNEKVQAVKEKKLNIIGVNFWENEKITIDKLTSYQKASVMFKEIPGDMIEIAVSDPTHKQNSIEIELDYNIKSSIFVDPRIQVMKISPAKTKLVIDVKGTMGQSITARFSLNNKPLDWKDELVYSNDFEAGEIGTSVNGWIKEGQTAGTYQSISEPLYPQRDFSGKYSFKGETGKVIVEYDFVPLIDTIDTVMVHGEENQVISDYPQMPIIVRASSLSNGKIFDARDGGDYKAEYQLPWEINTKYRIRMEIDLEQKKYNAFVTPEGIERVQIAKDYSFRTGAPVPENIGQFMLQDNRTDKGSKVTNYTINNKLVGNGKNVMEVTGKDSFKLKKDFILNNERAIVEWSFMKGSINDNSFVLSGKDHEGIRLEIVNNQLIDSLNNKVIIPSLEPNKWYKLKLDINLGLGKYNVFVNNELKQTNLSWHTPDSVLMNFGIESNNGQKSTLYVDDLHIRGTTVPIEQILLEGYSNVLTVGEKMEMKVKVVPTNAYIEDIEWSSSDESIAKVSKDGIVKAFKEGNVLIKARDRITGEMILKNLTITK
jgi:hyaluronate lyase